MSYIPPSLPSLVGDFQTSRVPAKDRVITKPGPNLLIDGLQKRSHDPRCSGGGDPRLQIFTPYSTVLDSISLRRLGIVPEL